MCSTSIIGISIRLKKSPFDVTPDPKNCFTAPPSASAIKKTYSIGIESVTEGLF